MVSDMGFKSKKPDAKTFELQIRFVSDDPVSTKQRVLAALASWGRSDVVEAIVDGIDDVVSTEQADWLFGQDDALPIAVYEQDHDVLQILAETLRQHYGSALSLRLAELADIAWSGAWDESARQGFSTDHFVVSQHPTLDEKKISIQLINGQAFGDGRHATTLVALALLEQLAFQDQGRGSALDIGTGNGILAIAAAKLGYGPIAATDIDEDILAEASRNAELNQVKVSWHCQETLPDTKNSQLIMANILAPVLHQLLPTMVAHLGKDGQMILSGFIRKEADSLIDLSKSLGLTVLQQESVRGWIGLRLGK